MLFYPFNPFVVGSTPARPTKIIFKSSTYSDVSAFFMPVHRPCDSVGPSPLRKMMEKRKLGSEEIAKALGALDNWLVDPQGLRIYKEWKLDSFRAAMDFLRDVAQAAELQDHHPDFYSSYKKITIQLTTHDHGGLTEKDFVLAAEIDRLAMNYLRAK